MTARHADHTLEECPDPDFCEQLPVWQITAQRSGTSHVIDSSYPVGQVRVIFHTTSKKQIVRKFAQPSQWEEIK